MGASLVHRSDYYFFFDSLFFFIFNLKVCFFEKFFPINVVASSLGFVSFSEAGLFSKNCSKDFFFNENFITNSLVYFLGVDLFNFNFLYSFIIFQGNFESNFGLKPFLCLPSLLYVEVDSFYFNLEGRLRQTKKVLSKPSFIFSDFDIIKVLFFFKGIFFFLIFLY